MSLVLNSEKGMTLNDVKTTMKVAAYLGGLAEQINGVPRRYRDSVADAYMEDHPLTVDDKAAAYDLVGKMEKQYKKETKSASLDTKLQYMFGNKGAEVAKAVALGAAAVVAGVAAAHGADPAVVGALSVGVTALAAVVGKAAADGTEDKPEKIAKEEWNVQKYGDVKRALFALKKMKKALTPESTYKRDVQALYASGLGNPGGMITALNLKQNGGR